MANSKPIDESSFEIIMDRISSLEKQTVFLRKALTASLIVAGLAATSSVCMLVRGNRSTSSIQNEVVKSRSVEAESFILKDKIGETFGSFDTDDDQPTLKLFDNNKVVRARLTVMKMGYPLLNLSDSEGKPRVSLLFSSIAGGGSITIRDEAGNRTFSKP
ncbi:MAG: hypothetical protein ACJ8FY_28720 [Gemmataceae bacterium]